MASFDNRRYFLSAYSAGLYLVLLPKGGKIVSSFGRRTLQDHDEHVTDMQLFARTNHTTSTRSENDRNFYLREMKGKLVQTYGLANVPEASKNEAQSESRELHLRQAVPLDAPYNLYSLRAKQYDQSNNFMLYAAALIN